MKIDKKLKDLPLSKSNPKTLESLFGSAEMIPMWIADMDFQVAPSIQDALKERISDSGFAYEYKPESFFAAQRKWYRDNYSLDLNQNQILFSPSITTSISVLIENFTDESEGIVIQPPVFMEFRDVIRKTKRKIVKNPLKLVDNRYQIDFEDLEEKLKNENNKILILCNPHNPVGRVWTKEEMQKMLEICKENKVILISDEIHKDIILFNNQFTSALQFADDYDKMVVCTSEAKTFNLCAITDSMAIIPNDEIRNSISQTFKKYNLGRTNALTRVALEAAYLSGKPWLDQLITAIEKNINTIIHETENSKVKLIKPEGTYQVWLDFRSVYSDTKQMFEHVTQNAGVGLNAGHWFGREGALFMRMNVATSNHKIKEAIKNIINITK